MRNTRPIGPVMDADNMDQSPSSGSMNLLWYLMTCKSYLGYNIFIVANIIYYYYYFDYMIYIYSWEKPYFPSSDLWGPPYELIGTLARCRITLFCLQSDGNYRKIFSKVGRPVCKGRTNPYYFLPAPNT